MACIKNTGLLSLLLAANSLIVIWISPTNGEVFCSANMNVAFVVDGSYKMGLDNFNNIVNFVYNVSNSLHVAINKTWIITVIGNETNVYKTKGELDNSAGPLFPNSTQVLLGKALGSVKNRLSENDTTRDAVNVVVLITSQKIDDGIAIPTINLKTESKATVFGFGIGNDFSLGQLREIASDSDDHHFMKANDTTDLLKRFGTALAKKICQIVDICVTSPCHNNGKCTSFPGGYNCTCLPEFHGDKCEITKSVEYIHLGCFQDNDSTPAIPSLESDNSTYLDGNFTTRGNSLKKCALEAAKLGYRVFALQNGGECRSGPYAHLNYSKYGDGFCSLDHQLGGDNANDVYLLGAKCGKLLSDGLIHLSSATINGSSFNDSWGIPLLDGDYSWCPKDGDLNRKLEINLGRETYLTKLTLQGKKDSKDYPDNYCFGSRSVDGGAIEEIRPNSKTCLIGLSKQSSNSITRLQFQTSLTCQYLNFAPWRPFKGDGLCLRIDVIRSFNATTDTSILREAGNNVTYDYSSVRGSNLTGPPLINGVVSWCPGENDMEAVLKVNLGKQYTLSKVLVQGAKDANEWPDKFCLSYSIDGNVFLKLLTTDSTCLLFPQTNNDLNGNRHRVHNFAPPRPARSVIVEPKYPTFGTDDGYCLRTELVGCITTTVDGEQVTEDCTHKTKKNKCCVFPFTYEGKQINSCIKTNHNQPWCATSANFERDKHWDNCQETSPCRPTSCLNDGTCIPDFTEWSYKCTCIKKFMGKNCEDDFDECYNSLCQNGGVCVNTIGGYRCECNKGYSGKNCHLNCKFSEIELGFVVDGSASVKFYGENNFQLIKDSMKHFIRSFSVSSLATRVGVIVYSTNTTLAFKLDQYSIDKDVEAAIDNITYPGGETFTGQALREAATVLFSNNTVRGNASKILVVITDGVPTDDITQPVTLINQTGVTTYVIGIGQNYDRSQLSQIALNVPDHVFPAEFKTLPEAFSRVRETICLEMDKCADNPCRFGGICKNEGLNCTCAEGFQGSKCSEDMKECYNGSVNCTAGKQCTETFGGYECTCANISLYGDNCTKACSKESTVLFLLDRARNVGQDNIKYQVEFIISVASTISFTNVAVISYATDAQIVMRPGQSSNFSQFAETLRHASYSMGHMKNLGEALHKAKEITEIYNPSNPAVVVAMILGKSDDEPATHAAELKQRNVTIVALTLDSSYSLPQLSLLTSKPFNDHKLTTEVASLKKYISKARNTICKAWRPCTSAVCPNSHKCRDNYGKDGGYSCIPPPNICNPNPCLNGGKCNDMGNSTYNCTCPPGIGGQTCTDDVLDECSTTPCKNGGQCKNLLGSFECVCPEKYSGRQCQVDCSSQRLNLVFLVDGSGSIEHQGKGNFQRSKDFIIGVIRNFEVGQDKVNVATILYSYHYSIVHYLNTYNRREDIEKAIQEMPYPSGGTRTGSGLKAIRDKIFKNLGAARDQVTKVVVVVTDGHSHDDVTDPARALRNMGVIIYSVGVGCCSYQPQLNEVATDPDADHVFEVSFTNLQNITQSLREKICEAVDFCSSSPCENDGNCTSLSNDYQCNCTSKWTGKNCSVAADPCHRQPCKNGGTCQVLGVKHFKCECPPGLTGPTCELDIDECFNNPCINDAVRCKNTFGSYECNCRKDFTGKHCQTGILNNVFDVLVLCDGSSFITYTYFRKTLFLVQNVLSFFNISQEETNVAAAVYAGEVVISFNFTEHYSLPAISNAIDNIPFLNQSSLNITSALEAVNKTIFTTGRKNVPRVLVVCVSGVLSGNFAEISQSLRNLGIIIIAVGFGSSINIDQLKAIATQPPIDYVFTTSFVHIDTVEGVIGGAVAGGVDPCSSVPCRNGGNCTSTTNNYTCTCSKGYTGANCEYDINECLVTPPPTCGNSKSCINTLGGFQCVCDGRYYGEECQHHIGSSLKLDFVFLLDGSLVVTQDNFAHFKSFVKAITASLNVSEDETHAAVVVSGDKPKLVIAFDDNFNQPSLDKAVDNITYPGSRLSNLGAALSLVTSGVFNSSAARPNATKVLVVLTASKSQDDIEVPSYAMLTNLKVITLCIGVGTEYSVGQLKEISSDPDEAFLVTYSSTESLALATSSLKVILATGLDPCSSKPCRNGTCSQTDGGYTCNCTAGFSGKNCDKENDPCNPNPCHNSGTCKVLPLMSHHCTCRPGWTGANCNQDIQECSRPHDVCRRGVCDERMGDFRCKCDSGLAGKYCDKTCSEKKIDLAFMIEGSASLNQWGESNFEKIVDAVQYVVKYFNDSQSNIGIVLYATKAELFANFSTTFNPVQIDNVLENLVYPSGWTNIGTGLNFTRETLFVNSRVDARRVLIMFTDGTSNNAVSIPSKLLRDMNVTILAVALGDWYDIKQVQRIASDPHSKTTLVTRFDELGNLTWRLHEMICEAVDHCFSNPCYNGGNCTSLSDSFICACPSGFNGLTCESDIDECLPSSPCTSVNKICVNFPGTSFCNCKPGHFQIQNSCDGEYEARVNIIFVIYIGESIGRYNKGDFPKQIAFVKGLSKTFNVSRNDTNVGIVTYSGDATVKYRFENISSQAELENALDSLKISGSGRNIGKALELAHTDLFNQSTEGRNVNVHNVVVVITDGPSDDNHVIPSSALKKDNVSIFSVGIDRYNRSQLNEMASDPDSEHVFTIDFYDGLGPTMAPLKDKIITVQQLNNCSSSPCFNGGSCINTGKSFRCACARGYYGNRCQLGCGFREVGLKTPNTRRIPDRYISASSQRDGSHAAHRGRIGIEVIGTWEDGWCSSQTDTAPYLQVFFEYLTNITEIENEGVEDGTTNSWVESYYVTTSNSTDSTSFVNYTENGETKLFISNTGIAARNVTLHGTSAHFIRIHPLNHTGPFACMRIGLYGCDNEDGYMEFPGTLLEQISNAPLAKNPVFDTRLAAIPVAVFISLLVGSLLLLLLPLGTFPLGPSPRETTVRFDSDPPQNGVIPLVPMYEVQSLTMELGSESMFQVESVNTSSEDVIFSNDNKIFSFDRQVSVASMGQVN